MVLVFLLKVIIGSVIYAILIGFLFTPKIHFILGEILHNIGISHRSLAWVVWDFFLCWIKRIVCHSSSKQKQHLSESFPVTFLCLLLFIWHCCETFGTLQLNIKHLLGRLGLLFLWWIQHMWRRVVGHSWSCPIFLRSLALRFNNLQKFFSLSLKKGNSKLCLLKAFQSQIRAK